jgi:hypothetical protein
MVVTVQSGESILISSGETFRALEIQNAGTVSNAGTSSQLKSARLATGSGVGSGLGSAVSQRQTPRLATGSGLGAGSATTTRFEQISASGIGLGFGSATNPVPFDPIRQIVRLLESTNDSRWRYGKPERIDPNLGV